MSDPQDFSFEIYMKFSRKGERSFYPSPRVRVRFFERAGARESARPAYQTRWIFAA